MKIAILGNGGREHALALQISKSKKLDKLYCIPGNAGTNLIGKNINLKFDNLTHNLLINTITCLSGDVTTSTNNFNITSHNLNTGDSLSETSAPSSIV